MTTFYQIPIAPGTPQRFGVRLNGLLYHMKIVWRDAVQGGWVLDISDVNNVPLLCGVPLVPDTDLLAQYAYLGIGGALIVSSTGIGDQGGPADFDDLGVAAQLYFVTEP